MSLTPEMRAAARRYGRESRIAQGLPETITDPVALTKIATILRSPSTVPLSSNGRSASPASPQVDAPRPAPGSTTTTNRRRGRASSPSTDAA